MEVLFQDDWYVAVEKPAGIHVHPPEDRGIRIRREQNGLAIVRDQLGLYLYPVHRIDPGTTGVLMYALTSEAARRFQALLISREVAKTYWAVARGHIPNEGMVDTPLKRDSSDTFAPAVTDFKCLYRMEVPEPVRPHPCARYSWVEARPRTGVYHQIRRHLAGRAHPIVGDAQHGDGAHNRFFRERFGISGLLLRAQSLEFIHPFTGVPVRIEGAPSDLWDQVRSRVVSPFLVPPRVLC